MKAVPLNSQAPNLQAISVGKASTGTISWIHLEEILLGLVVELHHRAEVGRATFLLGQQRVLVQVAIDVSVGARTLLAYVLVGRCVFHVLTEANRWLFRWHQVPILMPE